MLSQQLAKQFKPPAAMPKQVVSGIYLRVSDDDADLQESGSIQTQKAMLTNFCEQKGYSIHDYYIDDGVTGTNFQRPGFQRMLRDIYAGNINTVICKDLSRFGRNYVETGMYIENIFMQEDIRLIAPGDGVDTERKGFDITIAFRNIMNDMFARDSSTKTRNALVTRAKQGLHLGSKAPYGYWKDPDNRHHLVIDEEAAAVVRRIFQMAGDGYGYNRIAKMLRADGILIPTCYHAQKEPEYYKGKSVEPSTLWHVTSVQAILRNPLYLGLMAQGRRGAKTIKGKQVKKPMEDWIVVPETHEAIVTQEMWDAAQTQVSIRRRSQKTGQPQMYAGLLYCSDCGSALSFSAVKRKTKPDGGQYKCWYYMRHGKEHCESHYITMDYLNNILLHTIRKQALYATRYQDLYVDMLKNAMTQKHKKQVLDAERDIGCWRKRVAELDSIIKKLLEQNAVGRISDDRFAALSEEYEGEQADLLAKLAEVDEVENTEQECIHNAEQFAQLVQGYLDLKELNAGILNSLVQRIVVHQRQPIEGDTEGRWAQQVDIYFKFIGMTHIDL